MTSNDSLNIRYKLFYQDLEASPEEGELLPQSVVKSVMIPQGILISTLFYEGLWLRDDGTYCENSGATYSQEDGGSVKAIDLGALRCIPPSMLLKVQRVVT